MTSLPQDRREFLRVAARWAMLAGIGALGVKLFRREGVTECINNSICGSCRLLKDCALPAAQAQKGIPHG